MKWIGLEFYLVYLYSADSIHCICKLYTPFLFNSLVIWRFELVNFSCLYCSAEMWSYNLVSLMRMNIPFHMRNFAYNSKITKHVSGVKHCHFLIQRAESSALTKSQISNISSVQCPCGGTFIIILPLQAQE